MRALDFGVNSKLCVHGPDGPVTLPKNTRGLSPAQKFAETLRHLLDEDDLATESPTVGSCGADPEMIRDVVSSTTHTLYTLPARAVKNKVKDEGLAKPGDAECAAILYRIATENPAALQVWRYVDKEQKLRRQHRSVRPYDKRNYKDPQVDKWMSLLPPFETLPADMQKLFSDGKKRHPDYARARVLPFAMALEEEGAETREGYERIIGLYGHGFHCFYRRATVDLMQRVAKDLAGVTRIADVTREQRKEALKITRRHIRRLRHLAVMGTPYPVKGIGYPINVTAGTRDPAKGTPHPACSVTGTLDPPEGA
jgi:hypothetical protein